MPTPLARLRARRYSDDQPRDDHGRFAGGGGSSSESSGGSHSGSGGVKPITAEELAGTGPGATSGPGASREVSQAEFNSLAAEGQDRLAALDASSPTTGLDQNFDQIKADAYQQVQQSWGGATYDAHTGEAITGSEPKYALTVGNGPVISENASQSEFNAAMDQAKANLGGELSKAQRCLGVFHNDDAGTIEIDPVLVVDNLHDVETIGAATHATGGAYNFADGNGYWPPHVASAPSQAAA